MANEIKGLVNITTGAGIVDADARYAKLDQSTPQTIGATGNRLAHLWTTDLTVTNTIAGSISGTAAKATDLVGGNGTTLKGSMPYQNDTDDTVMLAPNVTTTKKFLTQTGDGTNGTAPGWNTIALADIPTYFVVLGSAPTPTTAGVIGQVGYYAGYKYTWTDTAVVIREVVETTW